MQVRSWPDAAGHPDCLAVNCEPARELIAGQVRISPVHVGVRNTIVFGRRSLTQHNDSPTIGSPENVGASLAAFLYIETGLWFNIPNNRFDPALSALLPRREEKGLGVRLHRL